MSADLSPVSAVAQAVATTRASFDADAHRREAVRTAASLIADGQAGKAYRVLCAATQRCARLSVGDPDPVAAVAAFEQCFADQVQAWAMRAVARRAEA